METEEVHTIRLDHLLARGFPGSLSQKEPTILTAESVADMVIKCEYDLDMEMTVTDCQQPHDQYNGPWPYFDSVKCTVHYSFTDGTRHSMQLKDLIHRGFAIPQHLVKKTYKYYSFIKFKKYCKEYNDHRGTVQEVESNEDLYLQILEKVHRYYEQNMTCAESEGIEEYRGPQSYADREDATKRLYYGKGKYRLYRMRDLTDEIGKRKGKDVALRFQADPTTDEVDEELFEDMLDVVNEFINHNYKRHVGKIKLYAGPQVHEDRCIDEKVRYDVTFRNTTTTEIPVQEENTQLNEEQESLIEDMSHIYLRSCEKCSKYRVLGKRAATKYTNAKYKYEGDEHNVHFECGNLVDTSCSTSEDILKVETSNYKLGTRYIARTHDENDKGCYSGLELELLEILDDGTTWNATVMSTFGCDQAECHKLKHQNIALKQKDRDTVITGKRNRLGRVMKSDIHTCPLVLFDIHVERPHEAKCCTPFLFNNPLNPDNHNKYISAVDLTKIRDLHSVYDSVKVIACVKCGRSAPGFVESKSVSVPKKGKMTPLVPGDDLYNILRKSEVIQATNLELSQRFENTNEHHSTEKSVHGICTNCQNYYEKTEENEVVRKTVAIPDINSSQEITMVNQPIVNPWSWENLMTTNIFLHNTDTRDFALEYQNFVDSLTLMEILVCSPIIVHMTILRSKASLIPVQRFGTIAYSMITKPMDKNWVAKSLPWSVPFEKFPVQIIRKNGDQVLQQVRIDMSNIVRLKEYMTRVMECPITHQQRPVYRFAADTFCPFSNEQMKKLSDSLNNEPGPRQGIPQNLREFTVEELNNRCQKKLTFNEFNHWLSQHEEIANQIWCSFTVERMECESQQRNTSHEDLWAMLLNSLLEDEKVEATDENPIEDSMTIETMSKIFLKKKWLAGTYCESEDPFEDLTCSIATEFEQCAMMYSNDEGGGDSIIGQVQACTDANPQKILNDALKSTVLDSFVMEPNRETPVIEWEEGYFQRAYPGVFPTGDADPWQGRPESIRNKPGWQREYLRYIAMQPRAQKNAALQFTINNMRRRMEANAAATLIIKDTNITDALPTKEAFIASMPEAAKVSTVVMQFKKKITDSPAYWQNEHYKEVGISRHMESTLGGLRDEKSHPIIGSLFTTSAVPYSDAPYIHNLMPQEQEIPTGTDQEIQQRKRLKRRANGLKYPEVVCYMTSLMGELQATYLSPTRHKGKHHCVRDEWGKNSNPHYHGLVYSEALGILVKELQDELENYMRDLLTQHPEVDDDIKKEIMSKVTEKWQEGQQKIMDWFEGQYSNWNPGLTAEGKVTYEYEAIDISKLKMATVIDDALSTGNFTELDDIYVRICSQSLRHLSHTGKNDRPSKKDYCYREVRKVDKKRTLQARQLKPKAKKVIRRYGGCKRRKPQPIRAKAAIYKDPHDKKKIQLSFPCNDKWFNGSDPLKVLNVLGNCDDKAIIPPAFMKPPKIRWENGVPILKFHEGTGISQQEYLLKYMLKDILPPKTNIELLQLAMETLGDDEFIDNGTLRRAYCKVGTEQTVSLLNACHVNLGLPLVFRDTRCTDVNVKGISTLTRNYNPGEHGQYGYCSSKVRAFDNRFNVDAKTVLNRNTFTKDMSMNEFFELYNYTVVREKRDQQEDRRQEERDQQEDDRQEERDQQQDTTQEEGHQHDLVEKLHLTKRSLYKQNGDIYSATRMTPHITLKHANPRSSYYADVCRRLVTYYKSFHKIREDVPKFTTEEEETTYWIEEFEQNFPNGEGIPDPFVGRLIRHYTDIEEEDDDESSSTESDDGSIVSSDDDGDDDDNDDGDGEEDIDDMLVGQREKGKYYQDVSDRFQQLPKSHQTTTETTDHNLLDDPMVTANPKGIDPHEWIGETRFTDQDRARFSRHVDQVRGLKGRFAQTLRQAKLNSRQQLTVDTISNWLREVKDAEKANLKLPKPLRLFVIGIPGAGKTFAFKYAVGNVMEILGDKTDTNPGWQDQVAFATATGAASYHMGFGAATVHRKFYIQIGKIGEELADNNKVLDLIERLGKDLRLIVIDEISTLQRQLLSCIVKRLKQLNYSLDKIGIVFMGDPAQTLPIGDYPVWSSMSKTEKNKDCTLESVLGIHEFRTLFRMGDLSSVKGFKKYNALMNLKRKKSSTHQEDLEKAWKVFANNVYKGDYNAVYLNESNRKTDSKESEEWTTGFIKNVRYGNFHQKDIDYLRKATATKEEYTTDPAWTNKKIMCSYHYYNEKNPEKTTVDSLNMNHLIEYANQNNLPIVKIESVHLPVSKEKKLKSQSGKLFRNIPAVLGLSKGIELMLSENINPSVGLFNGANCKYVGVIYLPRCFKVKVSEKSLPSVHLKDGITQAPFEVKIAGRIEYIPKGTEIKENDNNVEYDNINKIPNETNIELHFPQTFPALPDYLVVDVDNFEEASGMVLFEDRPELHNCTLIAPKTIVKETKEGDKTHESRKGPPAELTEAHTAYKGIGATHHKSVWSMKELASKPGCAYVGFTRIREPKDLYIPECEFPSYLDLRLQRLNHIVIESNNFERHIRIICAQQELCNQLSRDEYQIAKTVIECWTDFEKDKDEILKKSQEMLKESTTEVDLETLLHVISQLEKTDVFLLTKPTELLSALERSTLESHSNSSTLTKSRKSNITRPSTKKTTFADEIRLSPCPATKPNPQQEQNLKRTRTCLNNQFQKPPPAKKTRFQQFQGPMTLAFMLPQFSNANNICWMNSMMHIILLMLKHQPGNEVDIPQEGAARQKRLKEKHFWIFLKDILRQYGHYIGNFYTPSISIPGITTGRGLPPIKVFSDITETQVVDNQQHDAYDQLLAFLQQQTKLDIYACGILTKDPLTCSNCQHQTDPVPRPAWSLKLHATDDRPVDLSARPTPTPDRDTRCPNCTRTNVVSHQEILVATYDILLISIVRWECLDHDLQIYKYIKENVASYENIQINTTDGSSTYNVIATITHSPGTTTVLDEEGAKIQTPDPESGHYTAHVKVGDVWYKANDAVISRDDDGPQTPYVLLLKKIPPQPQPEQQPVQQPSQD